VGGFDFFPVGAKGHGFTRIGFPPGVKPGASYCTGLGRGSQGRSREVSKGMFDNRASLM
jgi:hypothetical protein